MNSLPIQKGNSLQGRDLVLRRWSKRKEVTNNSHISINISDLDLTNPVDLEKLNERVLGYLLQNPDLSNNEIKRLRMVLSILRNQSKLIIVRRGQEAQDKAEELRQYIELLKKEDRGNIQTTKNKFIGSQ